MGNVIIVAVLAVIPIIALKGSIKHLKGEGGCCGGGSTIKEPDKKLSGTVINTKVFKIDGMHCESCTSRVKRAINSIDGVSAKLDLRKKQAVVKYDKEIADDTLVKEIENIGYKVVAVQ
ncbi:heavy metal-associated domain-containing protein [uncultured Ruminococcus sp.]|uniref:heavy-metal-associated domain-containing protein n=1 Tax=uncultured Ruminococcus sp. TaxID=165186 RepID=UPI0025CF6276|nr:heavy metal-associated domain-containing protein [uncultured Ruminococcus sp.]